MRILLYNQFVRIVFFIQLIFFLCGFIAYLHCFYGTKLFLWCYKEFVAKFDMAQRYNRLIRRMFEVMLNQVVRTYCIDSSRLHESYLTTREAREYRRYFNGIETEHALRLRYPRSNDYATRQGDLMILKGFVPETNEKGVIMIHYTDSIGKLASNFNIYAMSKQYRFVVEPSHWGYQNVYFLIFCGLDTDVIIEAPYKPDYDFIVSFNKNFFPLRLGAGDWVNSDIFYCEKYVERIYDLVMLGSWGAIKRHSVLLRALTHIDACNKIKVALIGYAHGGRTKNDIIKQATSLGLDKSLIVYDNISAEMVARILRQSKIHVLLSKSEGANRAIYEGLMSGNVIILTSENRGVNRDVINSNTGYISSDEELPTIIEMAIKNYDNFDTATWALKNTGYKISSKRLNDFIREIAISRGEQWTIDIAQKINQPNNLYANENDRIRLNKEYERLVNYLY